MTTDQVSKVKEAIEIYLHGKSQNQLSELTNVNHRYIKDIRDNKPVNPKYLRMIADKLGIPLETEVHFENYNFDKVQAACAYALRKKRRVILDSYQSGAGKTYGLEHFASTEDHALYIKATSLMKGKDLIQLLLDKLKIRTEGRVSNVDKLQMITDKLIQGNYVIILDEFESCAPDMYRVLKDIEDATYRKCGFVLSGFGIINEIKSAAARNKKLMPQIWRRFKSNQIKLKQFTNNQLEVACIAHSITDKWVIKQLQRDIEDWAMLNEWVKDIHDTLINKGIEVNQESFTKHFA